MVAENPVGNLRVRGLPGGLAGNGLCQGTRHVPLANDFAFVSLMLAVPSEKSCPKLRTLNRCFPAGANASEQVYCIVHSSDTARLWPTWSPSHSLADLPQPLPRRQ